MKKVNFLNYALITLMMAFAMTLCYSCSKDDEGEIKEEDNSSSKGKGTINGHAYVVLAGMKWATENVGAVEGVEAEGTDETYGYYYNQANAINAAKSWGGTWTLPSTAQCKRLIDECTWTWKEDYSFCGKTMNGYIVSDKKDSSMFIFLPAAGDCDRGRIFHKSNYGIFWMIDDGMGFIVWWDLEENCGNRRIDDDNYPELGMSVRPVSE